MTYFLSFDGFAYVAFDSLDPHYFRVVWSFPRIAGETAFARRQFTTNASCGCQSGNRGSVTDRKNRAVQGLNATDFSIYEDEELQKSSFFSAAQQPVSLALLVDRNGRMGSTGKFDEAKKAVLTLVEASHPDTEISYLPYHHEAVPVIGPVTDRGRVKAAIATSMSENAGTSLYDPIIEALDHLSRANLPRQVLVVISERADQHSRHNLEELIRAVQASLAQIYLIGYFDSEEDQVFQSSGKTVKLLTGKEVDNPRYVFKRLAEESTHQPSCFGVEDMGGAMFCPFAFSRRRTAWKTSSTWTIRRHSLL